MDEAFACLVGQGSAESDPDCSAADEKRNAYGGAARDERVISAEVQCEK
jgi:hypothetical protein